MKEINYNFGMSKHTDYYQVGATFSDGFQPTTSPFEYSKTVTPNNDAIATEQFVKVFHNSSSEDSDTN